MKTRNLADLAAYVITAAFCVALVLAALLTPDSAFARGERGNPQDAYETALWYCEDNPGECHPIEQEHQGKRLALIQVCANPQDFGGSPSTPYLGGPGLVPFYFAIDGPCLEGADGAAASSVATPFAEVSNSEQPPPQSLTSEQQRIVEAHNAAADWCAAHVGSCIPMSFVAQTVDGRRLPQRGVQVCITPEALGFPGLDSAIIGLRPPLLFLVDKDCPGYVEELAV